jgi:hypothetical protein
MLKTVWIIMYSDLLLVSDFEIRISHFFSWWDSQARPTLLVEDGEAVFLKDLGRRRGT